MRAFQRKPRGLYRGTEDLAAKDPLGIAQAKPASRRKGLFVGEAWSHDGQA
jgi:hypothetical protein